MTSNCIKILKNNWKLKKKRNKKDILSKSFIIPEALLWGTIHQILKPKPKRIKVNSKIFNESYSTLATKLKQNKTGNTKNNRDELTPFINELLAHNELDSFTIQPTTHNEVRKILQNMRNDSSAVHDSIPITFLKFVDDDIFLPLANIMNNFIQMNIFPAQWKIGRICSILKVRNSVQMKNYQPISILPPISKVYEKVILK